MAVESHVGSFACPTSTDATFAVTGVGFVPKLVIFLVSMRLVVGANSTEDQAMGVGAMTSTDQFCFGGYPQDAAATTNHHTTAYSGSALVVHNVSNSTTYIDGKYVSFDSDGFTLDITVVGTPGAFVIPFIAIGGDIDIAIGTYMVAHATNTTLESPSLGFAPKGYLQISSILQETDVLATYGNVDMAPCFGGTDGTNHFTIQAYSEENQGRTNSRRGQLDNIIRQPMVSTGVWSAHEHSALGSDTFTITTGSQANEFLGHVGWIAFGGALIDFRVGSFTMNTSPASQAVTIQTGFKPDAIIFASNDFTTNNADTNGAMFSLGFSDGVNDAATLWAEDDNNAEGSPVVNLSLTSCIFSDIDGGTGAADDANMTSFDADGFTLNHNVNPGTAWRVGYFAIQGLPTPVPVVHHHHSLMR
jgi:hypothetical protein